MSCLTIGDKDTNKLVKICHPPLKYVNRKKKTSPNLTCLGEEKEKAGGFRFRLDGSYSHSIVAGGLEEMS